MNHLIRVSGSRMGCGITVNGPVIAVIGAVAQKDVCWRCCQWVIDPPLPCCCALEAVEDMLNIPSPVAIVPLACGDHGASLRGPQSLTTSL
jgi:hypothetical protein